MREFLWVTNTAENRAYYSDCPMDGLCLHFDADISHKKDISLFVQYLRHEFYFPIRCQIYFKAQKAFHSQKKGKTCLGIFCDEKQTDRGLEIQAAKYAKRIVNDYLCDVHMNDSQSLSQPYG